MVIWFQHFTAFWNAHKKRVDSQGLNRNFANKICTNAFKLDLDISVCLNNALWFGKFWKYFYIGRIRDCLRCIILSFQGVSRPSSLLTFNCFSICGIFFYQIIKYEKTNFLGFVDFLNSGHPQTFPGSWTWGPTKKMDHQTSKVYLKKYDKFHDKEGF